MTEIYLTIFFISLLLFFLGSGIWVGISMIGVSTIGMIMFTSRPVGDAMATTMWSMASSWSLTALPLFVWMGEILFRTKLSENLFRGLSPWLSKLPGGLIHVNILGCAIFAAISGSSAATVATVGKMSIPELRKRNYPEKFLLGTLAGSGTLGLLIPPSIILIIYGVTVEESIAKLFIAGIIPGIGLALLFMIYVVGWSLKNKKIMPIISEDFSENNIIVILPDNNGNYEYNLDGNQWQQDNTFTNVSGGIHEIGIQDVRGCGVTNYTVYLIDYPRFFTPNGDGYNDYWNIEALSIQPESKI